MELIVESVEPVLLRVNGEYAGEVSGVAKRITGKFSAPVLLEVTPLCPERLSYAFSPARMKKSDAPCRVTKWSADCYSVHLGVKRLITPKPLVCHAQATKGGMTYSLCEDGNTYLLAESEENTTVLPIDFAFNRAELDFADTAAGEVLRMTCYGEEECYFGLYRADPCMPLYEGVGTDFHFEDGRLTRRRRCHDMFGCNAETEYAVTAAGVEQRSDRVTGYSQANWESLRDETVPYAFLESLFLGTGVCTSLLSEELAEDFDAETAKSFFGNAVGWGMCPLKGKEQLTAVYYPPDAEGWCPARLFRFTVKDREITDIDEA